MTMKAGSSQQAGPKSVGMFDGLGAAEQASSDAQSQGGAEGEQDNDNDEGGDSDSQQDGDQQTGGDSQPDGEEQSADGEGAEGDDGEGDNSDGDGEGDGQDSSSSAKPITVLGRTYKSVEELMTAHEHSSGEGVRLAALGKEHLQTIKRLNARILELESKADEGPMPGELTDEQLELLPTHKQTEYILKRKEWQDAKAKRVEERKKAQEQSQAEEAELKAHIERNVAAMESDTAKYPQFKELEAIRKDVLRVTPFLDGRPETPYISWLLSYAIDTLNKKAIAEGKAGASKQVASRKAGAAASVSQKPGQGRSGKLAQSTGVSSVVQAYRNKQAL